MILPSNKEKLIARAVEIKEMCRVSAAQRAALARTQNLWIQTGRATGERALINKLYAHNEKLAAHLFSPAELRFALDFEAYYPENVLHMAETTGRTLTREWERKDMDMLFGAGVRSSLDYGSTLFKQMWGHNGVDARLVMPWNFGVYREDISNIEDQEALCESGMMTLQEVWRRISHLDNAKDLYTRIVAHSHKESSDDAGVSFIHQVISTSILQTDLANVRQQPGGIVQLSGDPSMALLGPEIAADLVSFHEMWVKDDDRGDYTTILLIEPDIILAPMFKRENQFAPKTQPYSLIQANNVPGYFWGRSEIVDLMEPQNLLATWMDDIKRVMGLQYDKILAFSGGEDMTDEKYDAFRSAGYTNVGLGGKVEDLTPRLPAEAFQALAYLNQEMDEISGFGPIMNGQGAPGVRAGNQADSMIKMASPRLRDRSLLVERQCAAAADKTLDLLQAKDAQAYDVDPSSGDKTVFLLADLPEDRRVTVDSHSSSPIFADDHIALVQLGLKAGFIDGASAIDMLPLPMKDTLKSRYAKAQAAKAELVKEHPEILTHGKKK